MIVTASDIRTLQRVEAGCPDAVVSRAINQATEILRQMVGDTNLATIAALPATDPVLIGGTVGNGYYEGLKNVMSEMVFALLATENRIITGFGTVAKVDEYSRDADFFDQCKAKEAHFREGVIRLCVLKGWTYSTPGTTYYTTKFFTNGRHH